MTLHRTETAIASAFIRYGAFVAMLDGLCAPDPERRGRGGIAKRPSNAGASDGHAIGDEVTILTDGGVMADHPDGPRWVEVREGRIVERPSER